MENRTDIEGEDEILAAFCQFRQRLVDDGYFKPKPLYVAYRVAEAAGMFLFSLYLTPVRCVTVFYSTQPSSVRDTLVSRGCTHA